MAFIPERSLSSGVIIQVAWTQHLEEVVENLSGSRCLRVPTTHLACIENGVFSTCGSVGNDSLGPQPTLARTSKVAGKLKQLEHVKNPIGPLWRVVDISQPRLASFISSWRASALGSRSVALSRCLEFDGLHCHWATQRDLHV